MKILELGMGWFPQQAGGSNRVYYDLLHEFSASGVDYRGLVTGDQAVCAECGGRVQAFAPTDSSLPRRLLAVRRQGRQMLRDYQPDVVASHFALYTAPLMDRIGKRPLVVHFHGPWAYESAAELTGAPGWGPRGKALIERAVYRRAERLIVLSEAFAEILRRRYRVEARRIRIVPGGVDARRFADLPAPAQAREQLGWPQDRRIVLVVRRLVRRMGLEDAIDAIAEVRQRHPDVLLLIAGRGPLTPELQARIAQRGLEHHARLLGFVPDEALPTAYAAADLSLVPTIALEGFGLITLESLAAGTPVLVTPVGGLPEAVSGLSRSLILQAPGAGAIASGLADAFDGRLKLPSAQECRDYARRNFDWPVIARRTLAVYREAIDGAGL